MLFERVNINIFKHFVYYNRKSALKTFVFFFYRLFFLFFLFIYFEMQNQNAEKKRNVYYACA